MYDNFEMRGSADVIQLTAENHPVADHVENYGGNAGESSKNEALPNVRANSPAPSLSEESGKQASRPSQTTTDVPASTPISRKGGEKSNVVPCATGVSTSPTLSPKGDADGHMTTENHWSRAIRNSSCKGLSVPSSCETHSDRDGQENSGDVQLLYDDQKSTDITQPEASVSGTRSRKKAGKVDGVHGPNEAHDGLDSIDHTNSREGMIGEGPASSEDQRQPALPDRRFTDPLVMEIVMLHRMRRRWMKAKNALILQGKAFARALSNGDKDVGTTAFNRVLSGKATDDDAMLVGALMPFIPSIERFDTEIAALEKRLAKLAKGLPVATWVGEVKGFGFGGLAAIVGEAGDLSQYRSISAVWKRLGLAVIDGEGRQRKVADAERALLHGYSPERRSIIWVIADSMAKLQRTWLDKETGEIKKEPGPYGIILEREKEKALANGCSKMHAENRAKRHMTKALLKDLTLEWRRISRGEGCTPS